MLSPNNDESFALVELHAKGSNVPTSFNESNSIRQPLVGTATSGMSRELKILQSKKIRIALGCAFIIMFITLYAGYQVSRRTQSESLTDECTLINIPLAYKEEHFRILHDETVVDDYFWMSTYASNTTANQTLMPYVEKENNYTELFMEMHKDLLNKVKSEIKDRDLKLRRVWRMAKFAYELTEDALLRWPIGASDVVDYNTPSKSVVIDIKTVREQFKSEKFDLGPLEVSPDENFVALSYDLKGNEHFNMQLIDINSQQLLATHEDVYYHVRWLGNSVYFTALDENEVPRYVYYATTSHPEKKELFYEEADETLTVELETSSDGNVLFTNVVGQAYTEILFTLRGNPKEYEILISREKKCFCSANYRENFFYVRSNENERNFYIYKLSASSVGNGEKESSPVAELRPSDKFIEYFQLFRNHIVVWALYRGQRIIMIRDLSLPDSSYKTVDFGDETRVYSVFPGTLLDMYDRHYHFYDSTAILFSNTSFLQPPATFELDLTTLNARSLFPEQSQRLNEFNEKYAEVRLYVKSYDQLDIPIQIAYQKSSENNVDIAEMKKSPTVVMGYGAYATVSDCLFKADAITLLERGIHFVHVQPRGDGNMGGDWYELGRKKLKMNTFLDMRRVLIYLKEKISTNLAVIGRSAGGLVAGFSTIFLNVYRNTWPSVNPVFRGEYNDLMKQEVQKALDPTNPENQLVSAIVADVPFVDVITDLLDASVPWTPFEWEEWGNPLNSKEEYDLMMDYSPYDNIRQGKYPAMLVTSGFQDTRVYFYEPTKMVSKIRQMKSNEIQYQRCQKENDAISVKQSGTQLLYRVHNGGHFDSDPSLRCVFLIKVLNQDV